MYARITSFKVDPARTSELALKSAQLQGRARAIPGLASAYAAWREDGQGLLIALYEDKAAADRAVGRLQALWGNLAGLVNAPPRVDVYDSVVHLTG